MLFPWFVLIWNRCEGTPRAAWGRAPCALVSPGKGIHLFKDPRAPKPLICLRPFYKWIIAHSYFVPSHFSNVYRRHQPVLLRILQYIPNGNYNLKDCIKFMRILSIYLLNFSFNDYILIANYIYLLSHVRNISTIYWAFQQPSRTRQKDN